MKIEDLLTSPAPGDHLPEVSGLSFLNLAAHIPAGPLRWHSGSVQAHMARCMNAVAGDPLAVWMALTHDAGKLTSPEQMWPHHYGHELRGGKLARIWAQQGEVSPLYCEAGIQSALLHMRAGRYAVMRPGKRFKLLELLWGKPWAAAFWKVVDADAHAPVSRLPLRHAAVLAAAKGEGLPLQRQIELLR